MEGFKYIDIRAHVVDVKKWCYFKDGLLLEDFLHKPLTNELVGREIQKHATLVLFGGDDNCIALEDQIW